MNARTNLPLDQLQAWVLSTYQRLERLDVPVFDAARSATARKLTRRVDPATLYQLPTDLPTALFPLGDWLSQRAAPVQPALGPGRALSLLLRYMASPLRYEPYAESAIHKGVPSARGLYPLAFYIVRRTGGVLRAYEYLPEHHAMRPVPFEGADLPPQADAALVCVARTWRIAEKYGEFANFPCVLEAGHAFAQFGHLGRMLGLNCGAPIAREFGRPLCRNAFELPLYAACLALGPWEPEAELASAEARLSSFEPNPGLAELFPRLAPINDLFDQGGAPFAPAQRPVPYEGPRLDVLATIRRRSAGNDRSGIAAVRRDVAPASVLGTWRALSAARTRLATESTLRCSVAWLAGEGAGLYQGERLTDIADQPARLRRMLPYRGMRINLPSLTAVLMIQADPVDAIERHGGAALRDVHLAAGAMAQDFCLAAASHGMFARPVRMMREADLESNLPLQGQVVYQVLCGFARRSNLTMGLL